jgi:hypothetical protein
MSTQATGTTVGRPIGRIASVLAAILPRLRVNAISYRTRVDLLVVGHMAGAGETELEESPPPRR